MRCCRPCLASTGWARACLSTAVGVGTVCPLRRAWLGVSAPVWAWKDFWRLVGGTSVSPSLLIINPLNGSSFKSVGCARIRCSENATDTSNEKNGTSLGRRLEGLPASSLTRTLFWSRSRTPSASSPGPSRNSGCKSWMRKRVCWKCVCTSRSVSGISHIRDRLHLVARKRFGVI